MKKTLMRKYARLAVEVGVSLKKGQGCIIDAPIEQGDFARMVAEEAYRAGAKWVRIDWMDQKFTKIKYRHETATQLSKVPDWEVAKAQYSADTLPAMIHIGSFDPDGMKGIKPAKMQKARVAQAMKMKPIRDKMENRNQWTIVAVPNKKWAKKIFPELRFNAAVEKLWETIFSVVRVSDGNDPVADWNAHSARLEEKCRKLESLNLDYLHYESKNGTDFKAWLIPGAKWVGGGSRLMDGHFFVPNMPTEEVFTTPIKGRAEGKLVATLPLSYQGNLIEKFAFNFKDGKVVSVEADEKGRELLEGMIASDEGAAMIGELALVPVSSPVSRSGLLFYNTLFDENAACHVALGRGFTECVPGYEGMSHEELGKVVNDSIVHCDFMVGSKELNITGCTRDGKKVKIFTNGEWAI